MIPIRCFSCGKPIGHVWEEYKERVANNENPAKVLDDVGLSRFCCRQMFLSHVELFKMAASFKKS